MMYLEHFGLNEAPFSIAPNPRYLYLTHQHQEALAHLSYGLGSSGGIVLLTGEVGTGKTTISRKLLEDMPEHIEIAWIVNPRLSAVELLAAFCDELSIAYDSDKASIKTFTDLINRYLIEAHGQGRNVVLMIDEAQNLSPDVLEQLRLLTNLETSERKLLQIILLGQPELKEMLARSDLRQLAQRITARFHLQSLSKEDSREYVRHRLVIAGCNRPVFSNKAIDLIFSISHGTPRLINLLCDRALLGVYSRNESIVEPEHVRQASKEVLGEDIKAAKPALGLPLLIAFTLIIINAILLDKIWPWLPHQTEIVQAAPSQSESVRIDLLQTEPVLADSVRAKLNPPELNPDEFISSVHPFETAQVKQTDQLPETDPSAFDVDASSETALPSDAAKLKPQSLKTEGQIDAVLEAEHAVPATSTETFVPAAIGMASAVEAVSNNLWDVIETNGTQILAFQTLAELWHYTLIADDSEPCEKLADQHLVCMQQRANSWLLYEYNRPAVFQMMGADGKAHFAVVRSLQNRRVLIQLGQQHWKITLRELEQYWQEPLTLLWKKPAAYQQDIQLGDGGAMIPWLTKQMDHIQGEMIPAQDVDVMNLVLVERVKNFQLAEGLLADGIVGQLTLIRINERLDPAIPRLNREPSF